MNNKVLIFVYILILLLFGRQMVETFGGGGGTPFEIKCSEPGDYVENISVHAGNRVDGINVKCKLKSDTEYVYKGGSGGSAYLEKRPDGFTSISGRAGNTVDQLLGHGGGGGNPFTHECPSGQVIKEITGRSGSMLDNIEFVCGEKDKRSGPELIDFGYFKMNTGETTYASLAAKHPDSQYKMSDIKTCTQQARGDDNASCFNVMAVTGAKRGDYEDGRNFYDYRFQGANIESYYTPGDVKFRYQDVSNAPNINWKGKCENDEIVSGFSGKTGNAHTIHCMKPQIKDESGNVLLSLEKIPDSEIISNYDFYKQDKTIYFNCPQKNQIITELIKGNDRIDRIKCAAYKEVGPVADLHKKALEEKKKIEDNNCIIDRTKTICKMPLTFMESVCAEEDPEGKVPHEIMQSFTTNEGWQAPGGFCEDILLQYHCDAYKVNGECTRDAIDKVKAHCKNFDNLKQFTDDPQVCNQDKLDTENLACEVLGICTEAGGDCNDKCSTTAIDRAHTQKMLDLAEDSATLAEAVAESRTDQSSQMIDIAKALAGNSGANTTSTTTNTTNTTTTNTTSQNSIDKTELRAKISAEDPNKDIKNQLIDEGEDPDDYYIFGETPLKKQEVHIIGGIGGVGLLLVLLK